MLQWFKNKGARSAELGARVRQGFEVQTAGDLVQAREIYRSVLAEDSGHADAHYLSGLIDAAEGRLDLALSHFDSAIRREPGNGPFHFSRGETLRAKGDLPAATDAFRRALELVPQEASWANELGRTLEAMGERQSAMQAYLRATEADPAHVPAWFNLGNSLLADKRTTEAEQAFRRALDLEPGFQPAALGLGSIAQAAKDLDAAESWYRKVLERSPGHGEALINLGALLAERKQPLEAERVLRDAVAAVPAMAEGWINLGSALRAQGRTEEALEVHRHAVELAPDSPAAHLQCALTLENSGDLAGAERSLHEALARDSNDPEIHFALANVLKAEGALGEAEAEFRRAIDLDPQHGPAWVNYAELLHATGRVDAGAGALEQAVKVAPDLAVAHMNLGVAKMNLGHDEAAESAFQKALELDPDSAETYLALGALYLYRGKLTESEAASRKALELVPGYHGALMNLGVALQQQGLLEESIEITRQAIALKPDHVQAWSNMLMTSNYSAAATARDLFEEHRRFGRHFPPRRNAAGLPRRPVDGSRRLRIGYVSPDFRFHVVSFFFEAVLDAHDRDRFEILCYYNENRVDDVTRRIRSKADLWRDLAPLDEDQAEKRLLEDELDVVVDLAGHTSRNRLGVLSRRVAPIQVTWLGYPNTTGLEAMDWRITDANADPSPEADSLHTERLYRMPEVFIAYRPPPEAPDVAPVPPSETQGFVTFCAYNNFSKVSDDVLMLWARILRELPAARLAMKTIALRDPNVQRRAQERLARLGCDLSRVSFSGIIPRLADHLATYGRADVALDAFPYHGTTTTCEALWMGVPVVSLAGDRHASRVGVSLLESIGAGELVASSPDEYVEKAVGLARDPARLAFWRKELRDRMRASTLTNHARFTRQLEDAYLEMLKPRH